MGVLPPRKKKRPVPTLTIIEKIKRVGAGPVPPIDDATIQVLLHSHIGHFPKRSLTCLSLVITSHCTSSHHRRTTPRKSRSLRRDRNNILDLRVTWFTVEALLNRQFTMMGLNLLSMSLFVQFNK